MGEGGRSEGKSCRGHVQIPELFVDSEIPARATLKTNPVDAPLLSSLPLRSHRLTTTRRVLSQIRLCRPMKGLRRSLFFFYRKWDNDDRPYRWLPAPEAGGE